jgi:hypothetical protein
MIQTALWVSTVLCAHAWQQHTADHTPQRGHCSCWSRRGSHVRRPSRLRCAEGPTCGECGDGRARTWVSRSVGVQARSQVPKKTDHARCGGGVGDNLLAGGPFGPWRSLARQEPTHQGWPRGRHVPGAGRVPRGVRKRTTLRRKKAGSSPTVALTTRNSVG